MVGFGDGFGSRAWFVGDSVWFEIKLFGFYYYYLLNRKWETEKRATTNGFNGFDTLFNQFKTSLMSHSTTRSIEYIQHISASICMGFVMQSCRGFLLQFIELKLVNRVSLRERERERE